MSDEIEWMMIGLDDKVAKRQGLPPQMPVPKAEFEGLADKGLDGDKARKWVSDFINNSEVGKSSAWRKKNQALFIALQNFVDKGPLWDKAQKAFAQNDFEKAISTLKRITVMDDTDHSAKLNLASAYANQANYEGALKLFKQVRSTFEGDAEFHMAVGQVHVALRHDDDAIGEMVLALEAKPDHQGALDTLTKLGVLAKIYENPRDAGSLLYVRADSVVDYLTGEWDKEPRTLDFFLEQLAYHERELRWHVVLAAAERAIKAAGDATTPEAKKGVERAELARISALRALGKADDALAAATSYAERHPEAAGAHVEIARTYRAMGKGEEATAAVRRALEADPGDLAALQLRFWPEDVSDLHTVNATIPELKGFAESHAEHPGVWRSLARALLVVGRTDEGIDMLKKAVDLRPADDDLRSEWWAELGKQQRWDDIVKDAGTLGDMKARDWRLRWNEAEAYLGQGKSVEARALFSALNFDESLHVDIRKRAKRAVQNLDSPEATQALPGGGEPPKG
jgi:tetratricopeptide (TPR) repeat protein